MQNTHHLYNDSDIPIMAFMTTMTISHLHNKQMNGRKDTWDLTSLSSADCSSCLPWNCTRSDG